MPATLQYENTHRDLVEGCLRGDRQAQFALYKQYARAMYNICLRMCKHPHDAEDVLQTAFVDVFTKMDSFSFQASIGAWIKRIVINNCLNHLQRRKPIIEEWQAHHDSVDDHTGLAEDDNSYDVQRVQRAVAELPDGYRVVLSLYLFEGYDHQEIGDILGVTESTSKSQYSRARRRLREILQTPA